MRTRTITAIVGAIIIAPFLVFFDTYAGAALIQIAGVICTYELLNATGLKKWFLAVPLYILALGLPLLVYFKENIFTFTEVTVAEEPVAVNCRTLYKPG